ncbi:MAG: hypothetical protein J1E84_08315 [Muribaculaceae bacterium]|nr:hypothetical protein [Muribaculaceae bacterium]
MFNAPIKTKVYLTAMIAATIFMSSCNGDKQYNDEADALIQQARDAINHQQYSLAASLLDSVDNAYPKAIDARREGMHLMTRAKEGLTIEEIRIADSLSVVYQIQGDSLARMLQRVSNPIENYFVGPGQNVDVHSASGLYGRLMPDGTLYMISSLVGRKAGHTSVTVSTGGNSATTATIAYDGEQNERSNGAEIINYTGAECDTIANFIALAPDATYTLTFNGTNSVSMTLPDGQKRAISIIAQYRRALRDFKRESFRKHSLEQRLEVIRSQMARTYRDSIADE